MIEQFKDIEHKFAEIERRIGDPEIISDQKKYQELIRQHAEIKEVVEVDRRYQRVDKELSEAKELLKDPDMADMAGDEVDSLKDEQKKLYNKLQLFLIPKDPNDKRNVIVEIRQGTGGEEAALFAEDLYRMYIRYAESRGWKVETMSVNSTGIGGIKEASFLVSGDSVFRRLKFEMGTHRVQRVPTTEASGRIHTSAATVAIMPEVEAVDVEIRDKDLRIDTYRASGAGGQHINKTDSAVRITHMPTGVVVACQDERSQFQNKEKAMKLLCARIYEAQIEAQRKTHAELRKSQVGSGDRSEKIRTYNFPQNRVTDHRVNYTTHTLDKVLDGEIDDIIDALVQADQLLKLASQK